MVYVPHTPELFEHLSKFGDGDTRKWRALLENWRIMVRAVILPSKGPNEPTALELLKLENETLADTSEGRPWTQREIDFVTDKAPFWSDKQMSRELVNRSDRAVALKRQHCGIRGRRDGQEYRNR